MARSTIVLIGCLAVTLFYTGPASAQTPSSTRSPSPTPTGTIPSFWYPATTPTVTPSPPATPVRLGPPLPPVVSMNCGETRRVYYQALDVKIKTEVRPTSRTDTLQSCCESCFEKLALIIANPTGTTESHDVLLMDGKVGCSTCAAGSVERCYPKAETFEPMYEHGFKNAHCWGTVTIPAPTPPPRPPSLSSLDVFGPVLQDPSSGLAIMPTDAQRTDVEDCDCSIELKSNDSFVRCEDLRCR